VEKATKSSRINMRFPKCNQTPLGIYPIVDRAYKLKPLYESSITTAQLRIKDLQGNELEDEIIDAIKISEEYNARFFVNDYWQLAIKHKAYGIHLGQEDVVDADIDAIAKAGIRLGISTHTTDEISVALDIQPSYVAIGPIYETTTKKMVYTPVGISDLRRWASSVEYPIVAIAGININNIEAVLSTKSANGIAIISAVLNEDKEVSMTKTKALIEAFDRYYTDG